VAAPTVNSAVLTPRLDAGRLIGCSGHELVKPRRGVERFAATLAIVRPVAASRP